KAIAIEANWQLDANSFDETTWQIEVVADSLLLDYFRSYLVLRNIQLQQGIMGAKIYSEGRGKNIVSIETTFQGEGWSLSHLPRSDFIHVDRIAGQFQWQQQAEQWQLKSQQLDVIIQGQQADITELEIRQYGQQIALSAKSFDLAVISMLKPLVASWLEQPEQYSISGLMQDLEISYDTASGVQQAKGQANDIVIRDDEHGVLMSNLSGEWSYTPSYSLFQFDSQDITIRPDENWQQAMHFEQVTGELIIQSVSDQVISIQTNELVISNPDMMVAVDGYSDYDLAVENILHNEIAIKVNYFDVTKWQDYIPSHFLDPDFSAWSENAFHAGQITHGQLVLEGEWSGFPYDRPETRQQGQFAWSAKVTDAELNYDENWPRLEKFTGTIAGHGQTLTIISESGEIAGYEVAQAQIDITPLWTEGTLLRLTGVLNGDSDNGLSFLAKSPLKQRFGSFVSYAKAKGDSHIQLALTIPLTEPEAAQVSGQIALENNTLDLLLNPTLRIGNINGAIQFGNDGVSSPLLEGQWQTTPVKVAVASLGNATQIKVESLLSDALLLPYWPKEWPVFMSGQTEAELIITLQERQLGVFDLSMALHSSLAGMSIDLPAPIAKKAEQLKPLQLHYLPRSGGHIEYQIQYDKEYMTVTRDSDSGTAITLDMTVLDAVEWQHWVAKTDQRQTSEENATTIALKA
ncbi:MAG TPA: hypothetical protein DCS49_03575, partial [Gammaproteobacteria bacterium]|nr:hypothetical protein [Gammaproteobacteria bacterium]